MRENTAPKPTESFFNANAKQNAVVTRAKYQFVFSLTMLECAPGNCFGDRHEPIYSHACFCFDLNRRQ
jgi:hypothetical protein